MRPNRLTAARTAASASAPLVTSSLTTSRSSDSRSEEHTSELQSQSNIVCRLLLEKKNSNNIANDIVLPLHVRNLSFAERYLLALAATQLRVIIVYVLRLLWERLDDSQVLLVEILH